MHETFNSQSCSSLVFVPRHIERINVTSEALHSDNLECTSVTLACSDVYRKTILEAIKRTQADFHGLCEDCEISPLIPTVYTCSGHQNAN